MTIDHENGVFEFTLGANPALVAVVRRSALEFAERIVESREVLSKLEVAVHELLENSVKYVESGQIEFCLRVTKQPRPQVIVTTRNQATARHINGLRSEIEQLARAPHAADYYREAMTRAIRSPGGSGLGLSRIAAESNMDLSCRLVGVNEVEVMAEASLAS